ERRPAARARARRERVHHEADPGAAGDREGQRAARDRVTRVKICGVTTLAEARMCIDAGVDAIGLNFVAASPRRATWEAAQEIADGCRSDVLVVGVVANASKEELDRVLHGLKLGCLQFHGLEAPEVVAAYLPHAYKALRARDASVVDEARRYPGDYLL